MTEHWNLGARIFWDLLAPFLLYAVMGDAVTMIWSGLEHQGILIAGIIPAYVMAVIPALPVLWFWYRRCGADVSAQTGRELACGVRWAGLIFSAAASCLILNHLLALLGIPANGYEDVKHTLFGRSLFWQVIGPGILIPLTEELVFRGLGYGRLRRRMNRFAAAFLTALFFGLYHGNLIQGIYAFVMGLLLAFVYEKQGGLGAAWVFHAAANLTSILLTALF